MTKKETEMILLVVFFSLVIVALADIYISKNAKIQELEHELSQVPKVCVRQFRK